jgi:hypothetical protein
LRGGGGGGWRRRAGGGYGLEAGRRCGWRGQEVAAAALRRELLPRPALHRQVCTRSTQPIRRSLRS